ncbi:hypothetical protein Pfo_009508 [Paulownia fortunei]|nr:hypothetical protein Pfo_009508 [Paulownia fortunei]
MWPGSYCDTVRSCCYTTSGKPATNFTIHGLWPHFLNDTFPSNCNKKTPYDGTKCNRVGQQWLAQRTMEPGSGLMNGKSMALVLGIRPDDGFYKLDDIKEAIKAGTGYSAAIECNSDPSRNVQLYQALKSSLSLNDISETRHKLRPQSVVQDTFLYKIGPGFLKFNSHGIYIS